MVRAVRGVERGAGVQGGRRVGRGAAGRAVRADAPCLNGSAVGGCGAGGAGPGWAGQRARLNSHADGSGRGGGRTNRDWGGAPGRADRLRQANAAFSGTEQDRYTILEI